MPYLESEKTRTQAEIRAADAEVEKLTAQEQAQHQVVAQAEAQVAAARDALAALQAQQPPLQSAAATADQRLSSIDAQIAEHQQHEPFEFIERPNKPPLRNPEWTAWKRQQDQLSRQRSDAAASATAAHTRLNDLNRSIAQASGTLRTAEANAAQIVAALAQLTGALSGARSRASAARQKLEELTGWGTEIDREPIDRKALEEAASALTARVVGLETDCRAAEAASAKADAALAALFARRTALTAALTDVNGLIPAAETEAQASLAAAQALAAELDNHLTGGL
jgi:chromosome segregation ATPase